MEEQRIPVAEGVSLHAVVWEGAEAVPAYLLVHGLSSNLRTWERVAAGLSERGHCVAAVDLRGHGRSDKPGWGYDFTTLTNDLVTAMSALDVQQPVVVGQSTGGNLAVELARRKSHLIAGAVGVDGGVLELQDEFPEWDACLDALAPPRFEDTPAERMRAMIRQHHPDWPEWGVEATLANLEVLDDGTVRPRLAREHHLTILRALWEHRPSMFLGGLDVPMLFVLAESDDDNGDGDGDGPTSRTWAKRAMALNPRVRVEWLQGDHDLHVHHPEAVTDLLVGFHG